MVDHENTKARILEQDQVLHHCRAFALSCFRDSLLTDWVLSTPGRSRPDCPQTAESA